MMRPLRGRPTRWAGSLAVTVVAVALLLRIEDPGEVVATLQQASIGLVALAIAPAIVFGLARARRFQILLGEHGRRRPGTVVAISLAGWSVGLLLPGLVGDAAFVWLARNRLAIPIMRATGAALLARLFDLASLLLIALATALLAGVRLPGAILLGASVLAAAVLAVLVGLLWGRSRRVALQAMARLPHGGALGRRVGDALDQLSRTRHVGGLVVSTALARCATVLLYLSLFAAIGHPLTLWQVWFALSLRTLLLAVPLQGLGGFGTTQLWWTGALTLLGFPLEDAVGAAFAVHVLDLAVSLPVGLAGWAVLLTRPAGRVVSGPQPADPSLVEPLPSASHLGGG